MRQGDCGTALRLQKKGVLMLEDYKSALRAGQRAYRARIARGQSPYLAVLDDVEINKYHDYPDTYK